jgi:peptidoglycan/xylan/chitin deacetylase (PgdA/CDA1 family)
MKFAPAGQTAGLLEELSAECGVDLPSPERCSRELMSWEQVREAARAGIAIGSHTVSHRVLATLDLESQRHELRESKALLEARLVRSVRTFAYPVGGYEHFNVETKAIARECGYEAAFSFHTGTNPVEDIDPFDIRRVSAPDDRELYLGALALPGVFAARRCDAAEPKPLSIA